MQLLGKILMCLGAAAFVTREWVHFSALALGHFSKSVLGLPMLGVIKQFLKQEPVPPYCAVQVVMFVVGLALFAVEKIWARRHRCSPGDLLGGMR